VLKLDDETFFDTHPPLPRAAALPAVKDSVLVYGFPTGGSNLSITKGIVSRIEFALYSYYTSGLRVQIDAATNPGNGGGPALVADKMAGLAFSGTDKLVKGYGRPSIPAVVKTVNEIPIRNLGHLVEVLRDAKEAPEKS